MIKGAAWFGLETSACHIGGSDQRSLKSIAYWLKKRGFNAIRVPFAADAVIQAHHKCLYQGNLEGIRAHNPDILGMTYIQRLQALARVAAEAGLLVLLDAHVIEAGKWPDGGTVGSTKEGGRSALRTAWEQVAGNLCDAGEFWNVIGGDLKNEPYGMFCAASCLLTPETSVHRVSVLLLTAVCLLNTLAGGEPPTHMGLSAYRVPPYAEEDRWDSLASELGAAVHEKCPRWLAFVQGVGHCHQQREGPCTLPSAPGVQDTTDEYGICKLPRASPDGSHLSRTQIRVDLHVLQQGGARIS